MCPSTSSQMSHTQMSHTQMLTNCNLNANYHLILTGSQTLLVLINLYHGQFDIYLLYLCCIF